MGHRPDTSQEMKMCQSTVKRKSAGGKLSPLSPIPKLEIKGGKKERVSSAVVEQEASVVSSASLCGFDDNSERESDIMHSDDD